MPEVRQTDALAKEFQRGSEVAFNELIQREAPRQLGLARGVLGDVHLAEDAVQEAFAAAWLQRERYDPERCFSAWMTRITLNKCRDTQRRAKVRQLLWLSPDDLIDAVDPGAGPATELICQQSLQRLGRALSRLPSRLREPLVLVSIDGQSYENAADVLGVTRKTVEMRVYRARKSLREMLDRSVAGDDK